jgi:hypothetical protein
MIERWAMILPVTLAPVCGRSPASKAKSGGR